MSTLNVNAIDKESGSTLTLGGSGTTLNVSNMVPDVALSNRNLIINGAMNVAQRGTSFTGLTNGSNGYTLDRFRFVEQGSPTFACTISQSSTAPTGFANSLKLDITTAQSSLGASDTLQIDTIIEAQNLQHLSYGSSSAKPLTLSFWVKSNKTGTYGIWFYQDDAVRSFSDSYTIDSADTWEHKTISVPADTVGVIDNNNDRGIVVRWGLAAGSNFTSGTTSNSWETDVTANRYPDLSVNIADNTANEWYITGVQLEVGSVATPFEHEFFSQTLAKCQRYYYRLNANANFTVWADGYWNNANQTTLIFPISVPMRSSPSVDSTGSSGDYLLVNANAVHTCTSIPSFSKSTITSDGSSALVTLIAYSTGNGTGGNATQLVSLGGGAWSGDFLGLDSEL